MICNRAYYLPAQAVFLVLCMVLLALVIPTARAQDLARVNGFVSDASTGQALEFVSVVLDGPGGQMGAATDRDGRYQISGITPGRYVLRASFIGYEPYADTLDLAPGELRTVTIRLAPDVERLQEVVVESERESGMARVIAGRQTVTPEEIELIPTPDVSGDLVNYLTTLPGVVSQGDRGGQLYVRGGEPSQNLVLLDGMLVYQPFHILGFYSAFPSDVLSKADVYAGGYGARFGERISSVIDVWAREGNKRRFSGSAAISPFLGSTLLEGPLIPGRVSFIASVRESLVEQGAEPIVGRPMPFRFGDAFAKIHAEPTRRSRIAVTGLTTHDRGTVREAIGPEPPEEVTWTNEALGARWVALPRALPVATELRFGYSRLETTLGLPGEPVRSSEVKNAYLSYDANFFGDRADVDAGFALRFTSTQSYLGGLFQELQDRGTQATLIAGYVEPEYTVGNLRIRPGARLEFFTARFDPVLEPRVRLLWERGKHRLTAASGVYFQEIVGIVDQRDAASIFTVWTNISSFNPRQSDLDPDHLPRAIHTLAGYGVAPASWLELSIEGFYKKLDNLFMAEWTPYPRQTSRLQNASGRSFGFDARVELRRFPFYAFVNYGLSNTLYDAKQPDLPLWFGEESVRFRPGHDRRHQINALANVKVAGFDVSTRWEFGSGLPFSRPAGFDGFILIDEPRIGPDATRFRRAIYGRPFNAVLPTYHRLDLSVERTLTFRPFALTLLGSIINVYDRRNLFYADVFTLQRADQLPFFPSLGMKIAVN